jgi:hypothetical protein
VKTNSSILKIFSRKLALVLLLAVTTVGAFATLGEGKAKNTKQGKKSLLSAKTNQKPGSFSLSSGYNFRGSQVMSKQQNKSISLNTPVTFQTGHTSYIVPLKKRVVLNDKIVFNPNAATRR